MVCGILTPYDHDHIAQFNLNLVSHHFDPLFPLSFFWPKNQSNIYDEKTYEAQCWDFRLMWRTLTIMMCNLISFVILVLMVSKRRKTC